MAKVVSEKTNKKPTLKSPAAFASKDKSQPVVSKDNPSKYAPGNDAEMNGENLDAKEGLKKLLYNSTKAIYWAENELVKALPKMAKASGNASLTKAILTHLKQTESQVSRLEKVFEILGEKIKSRKCDAMEGLLKEGEGAIEDTDPGTAARDLGIIMASQKVEHYEMASYKGLINLANSLGFSEMADILSETLAEEQASDNSLAGIAESILSKNK